MDHLALMLTLGIAPLIIWGIAAIVVGAAGYITYKAGDGAKDAMAAAGDGVKKAAEEVGKATSVGLLLTGGYFAWKMLKKGK